MLSFPLGVEARRTIAFWGAANGYNCSRSNGDSVVNDVSNAVIAVFPNDYTNRPSKCYEFIVDRG